MIRLIGMLAVAFLAFNVANAQAPQNLKGPAAKNYKPWKNQNRTATFVVKTAESPQKGPGNKNEKIGKSSKGKMEIPLNQGEKDKITGPKAKNKKAR